MLAFEERVKPGGEPGEKPLAARKRTNNKLSPHMTPWEASALTTT